MQLTNDPTVKYSFATRAVPLKEMVGVVPLADAPRAGDLVLTEVMGIGRHKTIEDHTDRTMYIFPGDRLVTTFGDRYATDQYEGYVPEGPVEVCDLLSVAGVCGEVVSRHTAMANPTRLCVLGSVCDEEGGTINQRDFGLSPLYGTGGKAEVILVVGSSMNSGKTTTGGILTRTLSREGFAVAAAKVTGTASGKDGRFYESCGAQPFLDFTHVGYPSTYMVGLQELLTIYRTLLSQLQATGSDYIVLEIADGIVQRETMMLLESQLLRDTVDHVFFASSDSLSADYGVRRVRRYGLPLRAVAGAVIQSPLASREAEEVSGVTCLSTERMTNGTLSEMLGIGRELTLDERDDAYEPGAVGRTA